MNSGRGMPTPARREPLLPAGLVLAAYALGAVVTGVFGGGAVSAAITGHGFGVVAPQQMSATVARLVAHPADPAAAWPGDPRPGPAWLSWLCISIVAGLWCAVVAIVSIEISHHSRHRYREGLAGAADLRNIGLDEHSAARKAVREYPRLAERQGKRWFWWRWRR